MIVIDRKTGKTIYADPITKEQNQILWEAIAREHVRLTFKREQDKIRDGGNG